MEISEDRATSNHSQETPFDNIESAHEYVSLLLEALEEAQEHVEKEIQRPDGAGIPRRQEALQLVSYKLVRLSSHISASKRLLNDLRSLRRLLLEERMATKLPVTDER